MADWIAPALAAVRAGESPAMVTVVQAQGSAPREAGARMLVWPDRFWGTIGGGNLERLALDQARRLLAQSARRHAVQDYPLGPLLNQCCGGHVRLLFERLDGESLGWLGEAANENRAFRLDIRLEQDRIHRSLGPGGVLPPRPPGRVPLADLTSLTEAVQPVKPSLVLFGAGHVGAAVARAVAPLPFDLDWLAARQDIPADPDLQATILPEDDLVACVEAARPDALFAIFTHSHDLDYALTRAVLRKGDFGYLGLIGSRTKRARFESRLKDDGVAEADLARLACPIGIPTLKSKEPAVIALSVAAQVMQEAERLYPDLAE